MIIDDVGVKHSKVLNNNLKIISLVPSFTELLVDLGLEDQIIARTNFCIYPKNKVRKIPKVGGTKDFNVDLINSLRPIASNKLAATLLAKVFPIFVISGNPDHNESLAVVWAQ